MKSRKVGGKKIKIRQVTSKEKEREKRYMVSHRKKVPEQTPFPPKEKEKKSPPFHLHP